MMTSNTFVFKVDFQTRVQPEKKNKKNELDDDYMLERI